MNYNITQALSGHGLFATYLFRFKKIDSFKCLECNVKEGSPEHSLIECDSFKGLRKKYGINKVTDLKLDLDNKNINTVLMYLNELMKIKIKKQGG